MEFLTKLLRRTLANLTASNFKYRNLCADSASRLISPATKTAKTRRRMATTTATTVESLLVEHSTQKHFIEYDGFLSNHLSHGTIALHRLGATEERLRKFIKWYLPRLEAPEPEADDARDFEELKGQRVAYDKILRHYEEMLKQVYNNDIDRFIAGEYPKISDGLGGSALHGTIHMGYGYSLKSVRLVLEGITYVYHSHRSAVVSSSPSSGIRFGEGEQGILDTLSQLSSNTKLRDAMLSGVTEEIFASMKVGIFQKRVAYLLAIHGDLLTSLVASLKIPDTCFDRDNSIIPSALMEQIIIWAITAYAKSVAKNDFFLLHGVTCAWAIYQILPLLSQTDGIKVIKDYLTVLLTVYVAQNTPALTENVPSDVDTSVTAWDELVRRCVAEDRDEHCYKLVQVCREMAQQCPEAAATCMYASNVALQHAFIYT